jgi:glycyl-tRNA synthetase
MDLYDKISDLGKRRGLFFPAFEIYGGMSGFFNYGPIGSLLKRNIEDAWRRLFVHGEGMVELESTLIMPEQVFQASGHLAHFTDILTKCSDCGRAYRVDHLLLERGVPCPEGLTAEALDKLLRESGSRCPECNGSLSTAEPFNLMFQVDIGSYGGDQRGYGRPEAGQGQFVDFKRIYTSERERLPLGIAQVGRCMRNEIAPRKGPLRLREFTIIDYEVFIDPEDLSYPRISLLQDQPLRIFTAEDQLAERDEVTEVTVEEALTEGLVKNEVTEVTVEEALTEGLVKNEVLCYFMALAVRFLRGLGVPPEKQRLREQLPEERAHYSEQTFDQEVWLNRWGWTEVSGHAYRTDYDLRNHMAHSGVDLRVYKAFDEPRTLVTVQVKPLMESLLEDLGSAEGERIARLLTKADPSIVARELREKGFYEVTGQYPVRVQPRHVEVTREEMAAAGRYFVPHVVEPSFGVDRILYTVLEYAYAERGRRIVLSLPRTIAAVKAAVFPLVRRDGLPEFAKQVYRRLIDEDFLVKYDASGSIGRRYARADEIGVPLCITIDYQSLEDETVTLRDLYTWKQVRAKASDLPSRLWEYFRGKIEFDALGTAVTPTK